jgi:plastocyanin
MPGFSHARKPVRRAGRTSLAPRCVQTRMCAMLAPRTTRFGGRRQEGAEQVSGSIRVPVPLVALAAVVVLAGAVAFGAVLAGVVGGNRDFDAPGMRGGYYGSGPGMMGGFGGGPGNRQGYDGRPAATDYPRPSGSSGPSGASFVPGTADAPRLVYIQAGPGYAFSPSEITVTRGETVTFVVTTMGPEPHEFMVGPADAVAADREGTPEIADIGMMETRTLTYTFDGPGPFAFACHTAEHYESGMTGTIKLVG